MREWVYQTLAKLYGWSQHTIAHMTPHAQLAFLKRDPRDSQLTFANTQEYDEWQMKRKLQLLERTSN